MEINAIVWILLIIVSLVLWHFIFSSRIKLSFLNQYFILSLLIFNFVLFSKLAWIFEYVMVNDNFSFLQPISFFKFAIYDSGQRSYGGFLALVITPLLLTKFYNNSKLWTLVSKFLLLISFSMFIGPMGCHIAGHGCFGLYTDSFFGVDYNWGSVLSNGKVHPTPLYDSFFFLLCFIILTFRSIFFSVAAKEYYLFLFISLCYLFFREFIRYNIDIFYVFSLSHFFYLFSLILISYIFLFNRKILK